MKIEKAEPNEYPYNLTIRIIVEDEGDEATLHRFTGAWEQKNFDLKLKERIGSDDIYEANCAISFVSDLLSKLWGMIAI
jgi:hypothetical protein